MAKLFAEAADAVFDRMQGAESHCAANPFTQGAWAPVEGHTALEMTVVHGELPPGLGGAFVRVGPNPGLGAPKKKRYHPFDGDGMMHVVRFKEGKALYSNAQLLTKRYLIEQKLGKEYFSRVLGELTGPVGLAKAITVIGTKEKAQGLTWMDGGGANTNTICFNGGIYALQEPANLPFEVRIADNGGITSLGFSTFNGLLDYGISAHPHVDAKKNQLIWHGYNNLGNVPNVPKYKLGMLSKGKQQLDFYQPIDVSNRPSMNHELAFTENYIVIPDQCIVFEAKKILSGDSMMDFDDKQNLRIGLLPRNAKGDETMWFVADQPIGIVHAFTAWEDGDEVIFWVPGFTDFHAGSTFELEPKPFQEPSRTRIMELRMGLNDPARKIKVTILEGDYGSVEFAKTNPACFGYPTRYGYGGIQDFHGPTREPIGGVGFNFRGLLKVDFQDKCISKQITFPDGCVGGDPQYIARPGSSEEDDGWMSVILYNTVENATYFHFYDASTLELTTALSFPVRVPPGFHTNYVTEEELMEHFQNHSQSKL